MTTFLLDVNVLIALIDPSHTQHETAHEGRLASLDRRLVVDAVRGGAQALHLIA